MSEETEANVGRTRTAISRCGKRFLAALGTYIDYVFFNKEKIKPVAFARASFNRGYKEHLHKKQEREKERAACV